MDDQNVLQQFVVDTKAGLLSYKRRCKGPCRAPREDTQKAYTVGPSVATRNGILSPPVLLQRGQAEVKRMQNKDIPKPESYDSTVLKVLNRVLKSWYYCSLEAISIMEKFVIDDIACVTVMALDRGTDQSGKRSRLVCISMYHDHSDVGNSRSIRNADTYSMAGTSILLCGHGSHETMTVNVNGRRHLARVDRNDEAQLYEYYFPADVLDDRTSSPSSS
ncbi:hypothetical protein ALC62_08379 [Cyphomyrmex costatus]|uniref:Uncharacterized protein n=1 Tax=Cyphomyrmex costatus TaxID=456900 RepID=A0A151IH29_9HYME|nr:hypothetical protein ALC62_08379 [Cyphomyrmex costatus]